MFSVVSFSFVCPALVIFRVTASLNLSAELNGGIAISADSKWEAGGPNSGNSLAYFQGTLM